IHVVERDPAIDGAVTAGELPAPLDDPRDLVAGRQGDARDPRRHAGGGGSGTAVTSLWRNVRTAVRVMRNRAPQCGSGHAMSVSVVIQSFASVTRCFAGR